MLMNQNVDDTGRLNNFFRKRNVIGRWVRYSYQVVMVNDKIRNNGIMAYCSFDVGTEPSN
jgi:hypothetical protein